MKDYEEVRGNLIAMLEDLEERLGNITEDVKHTDKPLDQNFSEQAVETENDQVLDALGNTTRDEIEKVKQAISRIDGGSYGICLICGKLIKKERLSVLPYSSQCIHCASKAEK